MRFRTPPEWPPPPDGWVPDRGWAPEPSWPAPPRDWDFWVNDYDVPVEGPPGIYGGTVARLRWTRRILAGLGAFLILILGVAIGGSGPAEQPSAAPLLEVPTHTVTVSPAPAP